MRSSRRCGVFCLAGVLLAAIFARAAEPSEEAPPSGVMKFLTQDYLFGTWGGKRTWLQEQGVDFEFVYFGTSARNLAGGIAVGSALEGALLMTVDMDSQKLVGYEGGHFHAGALWLHNQDPFSGTRVGDLNVVSLIDFPDMWRLWELWYEHKFFDGKVSLKLGQLAIDRDFIVPEYYSSLASINFQNQTFFYPTVAFNVFDIEGFPIGHHALASTPYGAPGVRLRVDPFERFYVQAGVYDGLPELSGGGTRINLNKDEGALAYFEAGYRLNGGKEDTGLPGNYKIGAYYHTDDFYDFSSIFAGAPETHSGNYGYYFLVDQMLYREIGKEDPAQQGLVGFFRVAGAPSDRNLAPFGIDGGLVYKGLVPTRDWDTLSICASYLEMSEDVAEGQRALGFPSNEILDYETVLEVSYRAQLTAWWTLQPDFQYVMHPGGSKAHENAIVFLLMTTLRF